MNGILIALLAITSAGDQFVPRDKAAEPGKGTAIVRGRVMDAESGTPLSRVDLSLTLLGTRVQIDTSSDADGRFEFTRLPSGKYQLSADPTRRLTTHRPGLYRTSEQKGLVDWAPIVLREGELFEHATIALSRGYVITARVVDEDGIPVADALVKAEAIEAKGGFSTRARTTDDLGAVRLWGYSPGLYRVCATPRSVGPERNASEGYVETCFPSSPMPEAQPVAITSADPPEVQIRLRRTRLFEISGLVVDANGQPAPGAIVSLVTVDRDGASGRTIQNSAGTFSARGLPPGEYVIVAESAYSSHPDDAARPIGMVPIQLQTADAEGTVVVLSQPATVRGRLVFEGGPPPPLAGLRVQSYAPRRTFTASRKLPEARVNADLSFELRGMFGQRTIDVVAPAEWVLKSVKYRGQERINLPTEFREGGAAALEVVLTNRPATLITRLQLSNASDADSSRVIVFPADPNQWNSGGRMSTWRMGVLKDGTCTFKGLRPADYFVTVVPDGMPFSDRDLTALEELSKTAERITLFDNDQRTIDLRK